ncbi:MAG: glucose-6-phosphate isomerase [Provencibacterium sp.]|jgi:glucose-6-phosphate isomerase|nr:glucose-6-phosphate isomerase [Provencibacterium sp.]
MQDIRIDLSMAVPFAGKEALAEMGKKAELAFQDLTDPEKEAGFKGWLNPMERGEAYRAMMEKAAAIRSKADAFVLVGVGGSNQAARAVIKALQKDGPEIIYAGNTLSAPALQKVLRRLDAKKEIYINVIAKNFETLEPGSHFRVLRDYLIRRYKREDTAGRIVLTGTFGSRLEEIAKENGYTFLEFPVPVGGRYSVLTPVGLFPMAVAGIDIPALLDGALRMKERLAAPGNPAVEYAALRQCLYQEKGFDIEVLAAFEPQLDYFAKWWVQLFGESEGKQKQGVFPTSVSYSEDLHSLGQYMQEGRRSLTETFLSIEEPDGSVPVPKDPAFGDRFDYLDGMDFLEINRAAESATIRAHYEGGVPCFRIFLPTLDAYSFGQLFYFFMVACAISGKTAGINPFDQEGVEAYKRSMFDMLGK